MVAVNTIAPTSVTSDMSVSATLDSYSMMIGTTVTVCIKFRQSFYAVNQGIKGLKCVAVFSIRLYTFDSFKHLPTLQRYTYMCKFTTKPFQRLCIIACHIPSFASK